MELFCSDWTGEDELKLLRSLEENGYGNWLIIHNVVHCRDYGHGLVFVFRLAVSEDVKKPPEGTYSTCTITIII